MSGLEVSMDIQFIEISFHRHIIKIGLTAAL